MDLEELFEMKNLIAEELQQVEALKLSMKRKQYVCVEVSKRDC